MDELESMTGLIEELQLGSARGGRRQPASGPVSVTTVRALGPDDIELLENPPPVGSVPSIPEIRHQHHQIAGLLARGIPNTEISLITGYSQSFISTLRNAPDMKELVGYYAGMAEERTVDALARLRQLGITAVEELQTRVNEAPEKFTSGMLMELTELGLLKPLAAAANAKSGMGAGGGTGGVQINLNFKAPDAGAGNGPLIEATVRDAAE